MRTVRIAILGASPCGQCAARCCRQNGHDYAVLLEESERRKFAAFAVEVPIASGPFTVMESALPYRDGRCIFLGEDDRCAIYDDRPRNCRRFECVSAYDSRGAHGIFLRRNADVLKVLKEW